MRRFNIRSLDLNLLSVFEILWDTRSVSRASSRLALTQSAVSHALKRLRERLDDPLFVPTPRGLVPTPRAAELIVPVREALNLISGALVRQTAFDPAASTAEYRIAATDLVECWFIPMLLGLVHRDSPGTRVRSVSLPETDAIARQLETEGAELALVQDRLTTANIRCDPLGEFGLVTMMRRPEGPPGPGLPLDIFLKRPHVAFDRRNQPGGGRVDARLKEMGLRRRIGAEVQTLHAMMATAQRTGCLCTLPSFMAPYASAFGLGVYELPFPLSPVPLFVAWHVRHDRDPAMAWLLERAREAVSGAMAMEA